MDTPSTNPPTGLGLKLESRTADDLSADGGRHATDDVWRCVQRGLVYPSPTPPSSPSSGAGSRRRP